GATGLRDRTKERLRSNAPKRRRGFDECNLGLGDDTPRASHRLFRTERARSTSQGKDRRAAPSRCLAARAQAFAANAAGGVLPINSAIGPAIFDRGAAWRRRG